jgi:putative flippase GtrA
MSRARATSRLDWMKPSTVDAAVRHRSGAVTAALSRQMLLFATIGIASTIAYGIIYALLRASASPLVANVLALVMTSVANTAANRRLTFGVRAGNGFWQDQLAGMGALGVAIVMTTAAIAVLHVIAPRAGLAAEIALLTAANIVAAITRFYLLRAWFERHARLTVLRKSAGE